MNTLPANVRIVTTRQRPPALKWAAFVVVALFGLCLRLPQLGERPMHTDEAINAYIVGQLLGDKAYTYDPVDRHGPALAALALPLVRLQGASAFADLTEVELRRTTVLAGTITILLFGAAAETFGFMPCMVAALLFACTPLPVYYDRYFIHESLFVAATFGLMLAAWRAWRHRSMAYAALAGACAALMLASKETALLHFVALGVAAVLACLFNLRETKPGIAWSFKALAVFSLAFVVVAVALFTWLGSNWSGLSMLLHAVPHLFARAGGQGHEKPFWYFGQLLAGGWSGKFILAFACIGAYETLKRRQGSTTDLLAIYALLLTMIYSAIPYKTPWLALNLWLPICLLAGRATEAVWQRARMRANGRVAMEIWVIVAALVAVTIAHDTRDRVFLHPADETNPYAYAHTTEDIEGVAPQIANLAQRDGIAQPRIAVIAADAWPLPWYLRRFKNVGFWQPGQQPGNADFYITSTDVGDQYAYQLKNFHAEFFGVRPNVLILLWEPTPPAQEQAQP